MGSGNRAGSHTCACRPHSLPASILVQVGAENPPADPPGESVEQAAAGAGEVGHTHALHIQPRAAAVLQRGERRGEAERWTCAPNGVTGDGSRNVACATTHMLDACALWEASALAVLARR